MYESGPLGIPGLHPRQHPTHTMGHKTYVLLHFVMFECIWDRLVTALNSVQHGTNWCI